MTIESLRDIWRSAFVKVGMGENCCQGCGHEVVFWEKDGVVYVYNVVLCAKEPGSCLVSELKIAGNRRGVKVVESGVKQV